MPYVTARKVAELDAAKGPLMLVVHVFLEEANPKLDLSQLVLKLSNA